MQKRRSHRLFIGILLFSILLCIPAISAADPDPMMNNQKYSHPISDHVPLFTGPYATEDTQNNNSISIIPLPPTPPVPGTTSPGQSHQAIHAG